MEQPVTVAIIEDHPVVTEGVASWIRSDPGQRVRLVQTARDLTAFLQYVGEPAALQRESVGVWVILFLVVFTFLAWLLNNEYWKDVH